MCDRVGLCVCMFASLNVKLATANRSTVSIPITNVSDFYHPAPWPEAWWVGPVKTFLSRSLMTMQNFVALCGWMTDRQADRQTDRQTDRSPLSISRVRMLTRDENCYRRTAFWTNKKDGSFGETQVRVLYIWSCVGAYCLAFVEGTSVGE